MTAEIKLEVIEKTMKENYDTLKATIEALNLDYEKFNAKKVKAAGARVRNNLLNCKKLCDDLRKQLLSDIRAIPIKHRTTPDKDDQTTLIDISSEEEPVEESQKLNKKNKKKK